jgi:hypothetical protein
MLSTAKMAITSFLAELSAVQTQILQRMALPKPTRSHDHVAALTPKMNVNRRTSRVTSEGGEVNIEKDGAKYNINLNRAAA